MGRLFDPARPHFAAWVWLYDIDCYWTERMPTVHLTQPEAGPHYHASLCGFVGLAEHLMPAHSRDVSSEGNPLKIARLVISGADVNAADVEGRAPLHAAARSGYCAIVELLLGSGASLVSLRHRHTRNASE
jgi:ankyrin repeat protein